MTLLDIHEPGQTPLPHEPVSAIGIDLGTTNSVVAIAEDGRPEVVRDEHGAALVPSLVWFDEDGGRARAGRLVGQAADGPRRLRRGDARRRASVRDRRGGRV
jgi:molecular chaperone HscA